MQDVPSIAGQTRIAQTIILQLKPLAIYNSRMGRAFHQNRRTRPAQKSLFSNQVHVSSFRNVSSTFLDSHEVLT